jgi:nucleotide-binding universal stress UspA family protein
MLKNLVVALDGSSCANHALELALTLAKTEGAKLAVCSVADPSAVYGTLEPLVVVERALDQIHDNAQHVVDGALAKARAAGISAQGCVLEGDPAYEIVCYAGKIRADAIVIGTHGRSGLRRLLMGSVAEGVLRSSSLPVLTVRAEAQLAQSASEAAS